MKEVALVLGGGGARGLAHVHVIEAFDDLGVRPRVIVGSSIGAVIGAGYAAGMTGIEVREHILRVLHDRSEVMSRLWRMRPTSFAKVFTLGELDARRVLRAFLPDGLPERFDGLQVPLKVTATDYYGNSTTVIGEGELLPALAASIAIPAIFRPEIVAGRVHVDGGISNPVAFDLAEAPGRVVVAVDVIGAPKGEDPARVPSRIEVAFGASQLMMQSLIAMKLKLHRPDLLVRPAVDRYRVLDFLRARDIIEHTRATRAQVRSQLGRLLEAE
ncbi:MAG: patatin [Alphaproteobacteria bacterium]|nr:MAG: patatin [Alphaproteobacteria bacterium]